MPPVSLGAVKDTVALVDPTAVAAPIVGAAGTVVGVMLALTLLLALLPTLLVANTVKVYAVPLTRPVTVTVPEPA